jgi:hypothetical protein
MSLDTTTKALIEQLIDRKLAMIPVVTSNYARIPEEEEMNEVKNIISLRMLNKKPQDHG